ncbi:hypothetical protein [Antrihabitans sp. YC2-6]|uniref:hypothetical protein n=1 Tax=Antrihabitans sp. YC2-6 TaxID=2799498 RepID=UPI0018F2A6D8|nr:hypothetical protein [Antrihabitans sp. YC2-6]MBJ8343673.1 hypothetical protein [Antrihabitans sp. YC2-6]
MTESNHDVAAPPHTDLTWISYGEFGKRFFVEAVTTDRIAAAVEGMAGKGIKIGPIGLGPGGLAGFVAEGSVGKPTISKHAGDDVAFDLLVPASLSVVLRLGQEVRIQVGIEIRLALHARAAEPLRIVIDIPQISHRDVALVVRAEALGAAWQWLLEPMGEVIRREVANRINLMTGEAESLRGRVFDIAARIDDTPEDTSLKFKWMTYNDFGAKFYRTAVTEERIASAVEDLDGRQIEIGPLKAGPKGIADVNATGKVGKPLVSRRGTGDFVVIDLRIPVSLDLVISLRRDNHYAANIEIPLVLTAKAADYLLIVVDVPAPGAEDIEIDLSAKGLSATVLSMVGGIKGEIAQQVASVVAEELADPSGRIVDVAERIQSA